MSSFGVCGSLPTANNVASTVSTKSKGSKFLLWKLISQAGGCSKVASELGKAEFAKIPGAQSLGIRSVGSSMFNLTRLFTGASVEPGVATLIDNAWHPMRATSLGQYLN